MATKKQTLGNTLAFRRALEITDGAMFSISQEKIETKIQPYGHGMRTSKSFDTNKKDAEVQKDNANDTLNLSYVEMAKLNATDSMLKISFTISFLPVYTEPEVADSNELYNLFSVKNKELLAEEDVVRKIASNYAYKILNCSWGWRNRDVSQQITTKVSFNNETITLEGVKEMPLHPVLTNFQKEMKEQEPLTKYKDEISKLADAIYKTLTNQTQILVVDIKGYFELAKGATVYPSQLFSPIEVKVGKSPLNKRFYTMPFNDDAVKQVGITAEKINNALRKFDLVEDEEGNQRVISIDPNGSDMVTKKSFRGKNKRLIDVYKKYIFSDDKSAITQEEKLFVISNLIRGGLFQEASDKKSDK